MVNEKRVAGVLFPPPQTTYWNIIYFANLPPTDVTRKGVNSARPTFHERRLIVINNPPMFNQTTFYIISDVLQS